VIWSPHVSAGKADAAWITAGHPLPWIDTATAASFADLKQLVVQDLFESPLMQPATWRLPAAGFAERAGTWVNIAHRAQSFRQAIARPRAYGPKAGSSGTCSAAVASMTLPPSAGRSPNPRPRSPRVRRRDARDGRRSPPPATGRDMNAFLPSPTTIACAGEASDRSRAA